MEWIFLSPHLDDVVFSSGGLVWEHTQAGRSVEIWTLFAGEPPRGKLSEFAREMHQNWDISGDVLQQRKREDREACRILGAQPVHWMYPDAIYRRAIREQGFLYPSEEALFGGIHAEEEALIDELSEKLAGELPVSGNVVAPLGIGNHVDHQLARKAASRLDREVLYYGDYPYVREEEGIQILDHLQRAEDWQPVLFPVSQTGIERWQGAGLAYHSQLESFWEDGADFRNQISRLAAGVGGVVLWRKV